MKPKINEIKSKFRPHGKVPHHGNRNPMKISNMRGLHYFATLLEKKNADYFFTDKKTRNANI